jgi:hypothetical protein
MRRIDSIEMEQILRKIATFAKLHSNAVGAIRIQRRSSDRKDSLEVSVSKTGHIRIDMYRNDQVVYARFNGKNKLVYGGATSLSVPSLSQHIADDQVINMIREELLKHFPTYDSFSPIALLAGQCIRYRVAAGQLYSY